MRNVRRGQARVRFRAIVVAMIVLGFVSGGMGACASRSPGRGLIHHVEAGENLYRIGLRYGVESREIARANGIRDARSLRIGQRLFIPRVGRRSDRYASSTSRGSRTPAAGQRAIREQARANARSQSMLNFGWPVRGRLSSSFGSRRGRPHEGIDIAAARGTPIVSSESGRVIHSGRMGGYGKVVIVKHAGSFRTVYAHASRLLVSKGEFVERGQKIAEVGSTGRSTGPHVHFEIRRRETPQNPLGFLP